MITLVKKLAILLYGKRKNCFEGPLTNWQIASQKSNGWSSKEIIQKTYRAADLVKSGDAVWEQDTIIRSHIKHSSSLIAMLYSAMLLRKREIFIIDVGGSLATNYYQLRNLITLAEKEYGFKIKWYIVEKQELVDIGNEKFSSESVKFFTSIDSINKIDEIGENTNIISAFTGSFQYIENPFDVLDTVCELKSEFICFDRLLISNDDQHKIYVQKPDPKKYYSSTYPIWVFSKVQFMENVESRGYHLVEEFDHLQLAKFTQLGLLFTKKSSR